MIPIFARVCCLCLCHLRSQSGTGHASALWAVSSLRDGTYEIVVHVKCNPKANYSPVLSVVLDRAAPVELAQHTRPVEDYIPGDDISVVFDELLDCQAITISARSSGGVALTGEDIIPICHDNAVYFVFAPTMSVSVSFS
jgi:hypothetical protein